MDKLLPCPFCGGEAETKMYLWGEHAETHAPIWCYYAFCRACDAMTDNVFKTKEEAIAAWNRRSDAVPVVRGEWRDAGKYMTDKCSQCAFEINWDKIDYCDMTISDIRYCPNCGSYNGGDKA